MNKQEATQLLALIKIAYPTAYKDMDVASKKATVNMWQMSFPDVPYPIMEQAFNHFRMVSKFPPTVAEMVAELKSLHYQALECALINKSLGNEDAVRQYRALMEATARYKDMDNFWARLQDDPSMIGGGDNNAGTPGNRLDSTNRLPLLDAGDGTA